MEYTRRDGSKSERGQRILPQLEFSIFYGPFTSQDYSFVLSTDGNRLAIQRGTFLTDCIDISSKPYSLCEGFELLPEPDDTLAWQQRSNAIIKLLVGS